MAGSMASAECPSAPHSFLNPTAANPKTVQSLNQSQQRTTNDDDDDDDDSDLHFTSKTKFYYCIL